MATARSSRLTVMVKLSPQRFAVGVGDDDAALGVDGVVVATEKLEFTEAGALLGFRRVHAPFLVHAVTPLPVFLHLPPFLGL